MQLICVFQRGLPAEIVCSRRLYFLKFFGSVVGQLKVNSHINEILRYNYHFYAFRQFLNSVYNSQTILNIL